MCVCIHIQGFPYIKNFTYCDVVNRHYSIITKIYNFCRFLLNFRGVHGSVHVTLTNLNIFLAWKKNLDLPWENAIYSHLRKTTFS